MHGNFQSPYFWAVFIGWILSVVLHEFAHGLVGYLGGDYTIRERGGLTLNPFQYIDPVLSILLPAVFLAMGGIPLPGGVTYIRRDLLRNRWWDSAVSLAGPMTNLLLFVIGAIALHPKVGWVSYAVSSAEWTPGQQVAATLLLLQGITVILNLIPIPPLDGFGIIGPFLDPKTRQKMMTPPIPTWCLVGLFMLLWNTHLQLRFYDWIEKVLVATGYHRWQCGELFDAFNHTLFK